MPGGKDWYFPKDNEFGEMIFNLMHTAKEWGKSPSEFFALPTEDKAMMVVHSNVMAKIRAQGEAEMRKKSKKK